jgi:hypothetical protein
LGGYEGSGHGDGLEVEDQRGWVQGNSFFNSGYLAKDFESIKTNGKATLSAFAKGTLQGDTLPQFDATLDVKDAMFRYPSLPAGVDQINVHANVKNPGRQCRPYGNFGQPFSFRLAGNPFSITAPLRLRLVIRTKGSAKGTLNLGMIKQVYPLQDMELNGVVNANMEMAGRLSYARRSSMTSSTLRAPSD